MSVRIIDFDPIGVPRATRRVTFEESLLENAARHRANGDRYVAEGKPDYAAGSYRKAEKFERRAADFVSMLSDLKKGLFR